MCCSAPLSPLARAAALPAALAIGAWFLALAGCRPASAPAPATPPAPAASAQLAVDYVLAAPLAAAHTQTGFSFLGLVRCDTEALLAFKVPGQIVAIGPEGEREDWREGTPLAAGAVLARLDTADFINLVAAARSRAEFTRAAFARQAELFAAASISQNDFEAARAQTETAEAELARAEQNLADTVLRAPYAGVLLARFAKTGEVTAAGKPVLRLGDFRRVSIDVGVPETSLVDLAVGQTHPVRLTAFPDATHRATISEIGAAAAEGSRLFRVVLKLPNPDGRLRPGMTASVRFDRTVPPAAGAVVVPLSALFSPPQTTPGVRAAAVYVVGPGDVARLRRVTTGDFVGSSIIITAGLQPGDRVVTVGTAQLHDGARVLARPATR